MANARICDQCAKAIDDGAGLVYQESIFVREAGPNAHADGETVEYDLHDECAAAFGGARRTPFLERFDAGRKTVAAAGEPKETS